jgi:Flp pilus assembly protein TadG
VRAAARNEEGAALLEFALVLPAFLTMLTGLVGYGGYFWRAHALQQVANDAARASVAGLTAVERQAMVLAAVSTGLTQLGGLSSTRVTTTVTEASGMVTVRLAYDGSNDAFLRVSVVPMPSTTIRRSAAVRQGGI